MKPRSRFFLLCALFCLAAGNLFGALIDANIHFVWMRADDARGEFFIKTSNYKKIDGSLRALALTPYKFRGNNPITLYKKEGDGNYVSCGEINIPAGVRDCAVILVPDPERADDAEASFAPEVLDLKEARTQGGAVAFCNLSPQTLRVQIRGGEAEKFLPGECRKIHALSPDQESASFSFKILAAAASPEAVKRSWRYANSMRLIKTQRYFLIAVPAAPNDDEARTPQCEVLTLREAALRKA